jgi:uncharacterized PurR-regulated membrane protein YhhQ (DUF165 family)
MNKHTVDPSASVIEFLFSIISNISKKGIPYKISFVLVFGIFYIFIFYYIKKRMETLYGPSRAINLFIYGFGSIALLSLILILLEVK